MKDEPSRSVRCHQATPMRRSARSVNSPVPPGPLPPQVHSETTAVWTAAQKRPVRPWSSKWEPQKHREGLFWGWWRGQYERKGAFAERKVSDPHWRSGITWSKGWDLAERRKRAQASLQAVPCLGDATLRERWQQHIEASLDPERDAKRIHWMISRLQMQGFNREDAAAEADEALMPVGADRAEQSSEPEPEGPEPDAPEKADAAEAVEESQYERRRRERRRRRNKGSWEERDEAEPDVLDFLQSRSKMGLLAGWLVGRVVAFLATILSTRVSAPLPVRADVLQALGAPVHWLVACSAAAWLGSLAVRRSGDQPTWKIGCFAACIFTLVG
ncbi:unnamed protein product [Effrenium voratum]|nr:unnamed protein product [Effrenium voratum]